MLRFFHPAVGHWALCCLLPWGSLALGVAEVQPPTLDLERLFERLDGDRDGRISPEEFKALPEAMARLQEEPLPEGWRTKEQFIEYASGRIEGSEAFFESFFSGVDKDNDGKVSPEEFEGRMAVLQRVREGAGANPEPSTRRDTDDVEGDFDREARRAVGRDSFPVFNHPELTPAAKATLGAEEPVIGVVCDGEARAYPIAVMGVHELGNDMCGKTPIAVSW